MLKNKDFKTIYYSAGNLCYQRKVVSQVNLVKPHAVNRLISVRELRALAIKHLVELSVEHEFFCHFFFQEKNLSCQPKSFDIFLISLQKNICCVLIRSASLRHF